MINRPSPASTQPAATLRLTQQPCDCLLHISLELSSMAGLENEQINIDFTAGRIPVQVLLAGGKYVCMGMNISPPPQ
jgi:hypothetical protein